MKKARDNGHFTRMVRDKLYIDNNLYTPKKRSDGGHKCNENCSGRPAVHPSEPHSYRQTGKRPRVSSTPDSYY